MQTRLAPVAFTFSFKRAIAAGKLAAAKKREEIELGGGQLPFQHR